MNRTCTSLELCEHANACRELERLRANGMRLLVSPFMSFRLARVRSNEELLQAAAEVKSAVRSITRTCRDKNEYYCPNGDSYGHYGSNDAPEYGAPVPTEKIANGLAGLRNKLECAVAELDEEEQLREDLLQVVSSLIGIFDSIKAVADSLVCDLLAYLALNPLPPPKHREDGAAVHRFRASA